MKRIRKIAVAFLFLILLVTGLIFYCDRAVSRAAAGRMYTDVSAVPYHKAGLLLGTGKYLSGGYINRYYAYRIRAAAALMKSGKVKYLIISGDNSRKDYDEPTQM